MNGSKRRVCARAVVCAFGLTAAAPALPQGTWKPEKAVEIVVNTAPGSGPDKTGRLMQKIMQDQRLADTSMVVVNKPGAGGAVAYNYLNQYAGNGH